MNDLKSRCVRFLSELEIPVTRFRGKISLSKSGYYGWISGRLNLAETTLQRIDEYLTKYSF